MNTHMAWVLATVNAPYNDQLDGEALAHCLADIELAKQHPGHVSAFFGEIPFAQQVEFAAAYNIPVSALRAFAVEFSSWSGESYSLNA